MALFFFISGYCYNDKYSDDILLLVKKRLKTLYVPFLKYELFLLLFHNVFVTINIYPPELRYSRAEYIANFIKNFCFISTEQLGGAFWFIVSLFIVNIMFALISYVSNRVSKNNMESIRRVIVFLLFSLGNIISIHKFNISTGYILYYFNTITTSLVALLVYYMGYIYKQYEEKIPLNASLAIISIVFLYINHRYGNISMGGNSYNDPAFFLISSICGIYINLYISKFIAERKLYITILEYIGKNTMVIIGFHFLAFKLVSLIKIKLYNLPIQELSKFPVINQTRYWWVLYSLAGIILPILLVYMLEKLKNVIVRARVSYVSNVNK
ncbi:acyltransferase family protein [Clostridium fungisolvens]|uniref:Acyltransferase 3 domain-containing protein n=1 Tax=Clostridium fungisolvens TaxID=1604897 RepID=A0A6V8SCF9_9CLOT|nr:acyltransferase family protein [Clostridium fungisolvens]GFP74252.1 hypothetical protein bsdtw1_00297 [Clostridium fungisolvens]